MMLSKTELSYNLHDKDFEIIEGHLKEVQKRSHGAFLQHRSNVLRCLNHINKPIEAITMLDIKKYFEEIIDKKNIKLDSKENSRSYLKSFFYYVQGLLLNDNIEFRNPVPIKKVYQFTKTVKDFKKISEEKIEIFTNEELLEIMESGKKLNYRDFILFGIVICTGMRISEALTIKIENINLEERYIETGFIKNARKSNKALLFFFPEGFTPYLKRYLRFLNKKVGWLFPGRQSYYLYGSFHHYLRRNFDEKYSKCHRYRKTFITNLIKKGCPLLISEMLLNHKSSSVEGEHYIKLSIPEKREYFDRYFPYKDFPYF